MAALGGRKSDGPGEMNNGEWLQCDLFDETCSAEDAGELIDLPEGEATLYRRVFTRCRHDDLFHILSDEIPWQQHRITVYGRVIAAPRLSAWYGDPGAAYSYSGLKLEPLPWTPALTEIRTVSEELAGTRFNSALLNLYRDGRDSVGWHSDDESTLGRNPVIASVSLGATRRFVLRHKKRPLQVELDLEPGSVLIMAGATQHHWRHQLPKTRQPVGPRINLTFRLIVYPEKAGHRSLD
jgi:alkylated DNA repair dioxygenase AlkB